MKYTLTITFFTTILLGCFTTKDSNNTKQGQKTTVNKYVVGFYNVENLFDTEDNPDTNDDDFTEGGIKEWNNDRYLDKLAKISEVITNINTNNLPAAFGLCEVENKKVVQDLLKTGELREAKYDLVHFESGDERGIDNAFIYRTDIFSVVDAKAITPDVSFNGEEDHTRDILYVKTKLKKGAEEIHFFINHFPSRSGGQEESEPKRIAVAKLLVESIAEIRFQNEDASIIILGDFNDMPNNTSIREVLGACPLVENCYLTNLSYPYHEKKQGTYNYRGNWNVLDQIIVSSPLTKIENKIYIENNEAKIMIDPFVMYTSEDGTTTPSRTYGGNNYYGGFSDHLATYTTIVVKD